MRNSRRAVFGVWLLSTLLAPLAAMAQSDYPSKVIKIIIPFPAGSGTDTSARFVGQLLTQQTGQTVIVDNKPGANGFIAAQAAAQAPPDGYTVFVTTMTTQAVNPFLFKKLPYDPIKDFQAVSLISKSPMLLVMRNTPDQPNSVAELTARAKSMPGKLTFSSGSTSARIAGETYKQVAGIDLLHVPYKGSPQALTDLLGGRIDLMFPDLTPSVPLVKDGRLRALAVTGTKRIATLPDVPTMAEAGLPGFDLVTWSAAYLPAKTPKPIVDRLSELIGKGLSTDEARVHYARTGSAPSPTSPAELEAFTKSEMAKWGRAVKAAGIEPE